MTWGDVADRLAAKDIEIVAAAADRGERCPLSIPFGPLRNTAIRRLAALGVIKIEIYRKNYRVIKVLTGPHAGKSTAPPPDPKLTPWLVIDANGRHKQEKDVPAATRRIFAPENLDPVRWARPERPQPSKPRMLTREEISKL